MVLLDTGSGGGDSSSSGGVSSSSGGQTASCPSPAYHCDDEANDAADAGDAGEVTEPVGCGNPDDVPVKAIAAGRTHTCALNTSGDVLTNVEAIAAGGAQTCALTTAGTVRCWGTATWYSPYVATSQYYPRIGYSNTLSTDLLTGVKAIAVGDTHACALMKSDSVRCWGYSEYGELGFTPPEQTCPSQGHAAADCVFWSPTRTFHGPTCDLLSCVRAIAAGSAHTCALMSNGGVRCWGSNTYGQLGHGLTYGSALPTNDVLTGVQAIATGDAHSCALMTTGGVRCWGGNSYGQLGDGTYTGTLTPPSNDVLAAVQAITTGDYHTCALMTTGGVRCWGRNNYGQLGDGGPHTVARPPSSDFLTGVQAITAGESHTCALMMTGGVRCWGDNTSGQRGTTVPTSSWTPVPVPGTCR